MSLVFFRLLVLLLVFRSLFLVARHGGGACCPCVQVSDISLTSTCEHHFVTIDGTATVSYIPKDTVLGLSKINRLVGFFAQRPQVQERLTQQVLVAIQTLTGSEDVAVSINATHYCVKARGIRDTNSYTKTSALGGKFLEDAELRRQFFA